MSAVESHDFGLTGRGLRCTRAVTAGDELLTVPLEAVEREWHLVVLSAALLAEVVACARAHIDVHKQHLVLEQESARVVIQLVSRRVPESHEAALEVAPVAVLRRWSCWGTL